MSAAPESTSSYALCALRDLALVSEQLRELQAVLQPAAEQGYSLQPANKLASLSTAIDAGRGALAESLGALSISVRKNKLIESSPSSSTAYSSEQELQELVAPASTTLKDLTAQAAKLHQTVAEERQMLLVLEEQESGSATRTQEMFELLDINGQEHALEVPSLSTGRICCRFSSPIAPPAKVCSRSPLAAPQATARSTTTSLRQVLPRC